MTLSALLATHDACERMARDFQPAVPFSIPRGKNVQYACFCTLQGYSLFLSIYVGPRGGQDGSITILDRTQPAAADRVFKRSLEHFRYNPFARSVKPLLDYSAKRVSSREQIYTYLSDCIAALLALSPADAQNLIRAHLTQNGFEFSSGSVDALPGGAPGLRG